MFGVCSLGDKKGTCVMFVRFAHRNISKGDCCLYRFLSPYTGAVKKLLNLYLVCLSKSNGRLFIELLFSSLYRGAIKKFLNLYLVCLS